MKAIKTINKKKSKKVFSKKAAITLLIAIVILATLLRLYSISTESYWLDEAISIRQAQHDDLEDTLERVKNDIHLPFYITILHFWVKLFGIGEFASRSLSLIFGVAGILALFFLARRLFGDKTALIASALMAFSPIMIYYSQEARLYTLFVLLSILSFDMFVKYLREPKAKNMILYLCVTLPLIYTHIFGFLVLASQNIVIFLHSRLNIKKIWRWILSQALLVAMFIPWMPIFLRQMTSKNNTVWIPYPGIYLVLESLVDLIGNIFIAIIFFILSGFFISELKNMKNEEMERLLILLSWIIIPFVLVLSYSYAFSPIYHTRYMLFTLPALFMLFAWVIQSFCKRFTQKTGRYVFMAIMALLVILSAFSIYEQYKDIDKDNWKDATVFLKNNAGQDDIIIVDPFYHNDPFTYYYSRDCFKEQYVGECNFENYNVITLSWDAICCNDSTRTSAKSGHVTLHSLENETVWLVSLRAELYVSGKKLHDYLDESHNITQVKSFDDIAIYKFEQIAEE